MTPRWRREAACGGVWPGFSPITAGCGRRPGRRCPRGSRGDQVQVLGLARTSGGDAALLLAGTDLLAAWRDGTRWTVSAPVPAAGGIAASGFGPGGSVWVLLGGGRAEAVAGAGGSWRALPPVPRGNGDARARDRRRVRRAGGLRVGAHGVAAGRGGLGQGPGDQRADRVRFLRLADISAGTSRRRRNRGRVAGYARGSHYFDGLARVCYGTRTVQKTHVTQLKFPAPAAMETWVVGLPRRADPAGGRCQRGSGSPARRTQSSAGVAVHTWTRPLTCACPGSGPPSRQGTNAPAQVNADFHAAHPTLLGC